MPRHTIRTFLVSAVFIAAIAFPFVNDRLVLIKDIPDLENRNKAALPLPDLNHLDPFPEKFEKYFNDHVSLRSLVVKAYSNFNVRLFGKSPLPEKVALGKAGWLYLAGDELLSYQGKDGLSGEELEAFRLELEYRKRYLERRNCRFYFVIIPVKADVYDEYMPDNLRRYNQSWGEQLREFLELNSEVKPVRIREMLRGNKDKGLLYYKLDNHWTHLGAMLVANELVKRIGKDFPGIEFLSADEYNVSTRLINSGNAVNMLSNVEQYNDTFYELSPKNGFKAREARKMGHPAPAQFPYAWGYEQVKEINGSGKPRLLLISDSFGDNLLLFLAESFSRTSRIFDAWEYKLNEDVVAKEQPDVEVLIVLESNLRNLLRHQSRFGKANR